MSRPTILLIGAGGHALACIDVVEQEGRFAIAGLVGSDEDRGRRVAGYDVVGTDADLPALRRAHEHAIVATGQIKSAAVRLRLHAALEAGGWTLPVITSPRAYRSPHGTVGEGTIIMHGAIVNAGATVGRNCIVNSTALVEHDVVVGDHCHVATGAVLNGGVVVGARTFVGSGAVVRQGVRIGDDCVIGMGQLVRRDCAAGEWLPVTVRSA